MHSTPSRLMYPATVSADSAHRRCGVACSSRLLLGLLLSRVPLTNLVILALAVAALLSALVCVGPAGIAQALDDNLRGYGLALGMLGYLVVAYRLSMSPDSSFAASWVLASGPLAFMCASAVARERSSSRVLSLDRWCRRDRARDALRVRFVLFGERAHAAAGRPEQLCDAAVSDVDSAGALASRAWLARTRLTRSACTSMVLVASFVLVLAIIATRSRTSLLIVAVRVRSLGRVRRDLARLLSRAIRDGAVAAAALARSPALVRQPDGRVGEGARVRRRDVHPGGVAPRRARDVRAASAGSRRVLFPVAVSDVSFDARTGNGGLFVHNDYVQFLVEGGVPLLILLLVFVAVVCGSWIVSWLGWRRRSTVRRNLALRWPSRHVARMRRSTSSSTACRFGFSLDCWRRVCSPCR